MTPEQIEAAKKVVKLSILIPVTPVRFPMLNNLYMELRRQIDQGGYLGKGLEKWYEDTPIMNGEVQKKDEGGNLMYASVQRSFKHPDIVEVIIDKSDKTIGEKRNNLLNKALGEYVCFIDSDDWVSKDYVKLLMKGIETNPDCISLKGVMTTDGQNPELFEHSLKHLAWRTNKNAGPDEVRYERYPNHLNAIRSDIAKQFQFPEKNFGEDHDWSTNVFKSGLLKNEYRIEEVIYQYRFISKKAIA